MSLRSRTYAIGDVHGRLDLLAALLRQIEHDQAARGSAATQIILLGDIVDRGPDSNRVVQICMELTRLSEQFIVLKGNHEDIMVAALLEADLEVFQQWLTFGGRETLISWGIKPLEIDTAAATETVRHAIRAVGVDVLRWLERLPLSIWQEKNFFVHAGVRPGLALHKQHPDDLMWITNEFLSSDADHGALIVHGHSITEAGPTVLPNRIGIDTGAYRTNRLTALGIEGAETWILDTSDVQSREGVANEAGLRESVRKILGLEEDLAARRLPLPVSSTRSVLSRGQRPTPAQIGAASLTVAAIAAAGLFFSLPGLHGPPVVSWPHRAPYTRIATRIAAPPDGREVSLNRTGDGHLSSLHSAHVPAGNPPPVTYYAHTAEASKTGSDTDRADRIGGNDSRETSPATPSRTGPSEVPSRVAVLGSGTSTANFVTDVVPEFIPNIGPTSALGISFETEVEKRSRRDSLESIRLLRRQL